MESTSPRCHYSGAWPPSPGQAPPSPAGPRRPRRRASMRRRSCFVGRGPPTSRRGPLEPPLRGARSRSAPTRPSPRSSAAATRAEPRFCGHPRARRPCGASRRPAPRRRRPALRPSAGFDALGVQAHPAAGDLLDREQRVLKNRAAQATCRSGRPPRLTSCRRRGLARCLSMEIACTLEPHDLAAQRERWLRLIAASAVARRTPEGLRIRFRADAGVAEELAELLATERECCAWASWTVVAPPTAVVLDVPSHGDGVAALHSMFTEARRQHPRVAPNDTHAAFAAGGGAGRHRAREPVVRLALRAGPRRPRAGRQGPARPRSRRARDRRRSRCSARSTPG